MRVLHLVKTVDGAQWAVDQVSQLVKAGVDVDVALPKLEGRFIERWRKTGASLHQLPVDLPVRSPWLIPQHLINLKRFVEGIKPDLIHSHFFGTTISLRLALGRDHITPRLFQVPGPLHLEHAAFRYWELSTAGEQDFWIASSHYIKNLYSNFGVKSNKIFLSYYGNALPEYSNHSGFLRNKLGIDHDTKIIGNINYIYKPKWFLGQAQGLKRHEDVIDAIALVCKYRSDVIGVLIGGQWGGGNDYLQKLQKRAQRACSGSIILPGYWPAAEVSSAWQDFDLAVHVPLSENCGGVVEPLLAKVPVLAANVGGLPEVILEGITGKIVAGDSVENLAQAINEVLNNIDIHKNYAFKGSQLVTSMFDVNRTSKEVHAIYNHILNNESRPEFFDSLDFIQKLAGQNV